MKQILSIK